MNIRPFTGTSRTITQDSTSESNIKKGKNSTKRELIEEVDVNQEVENFDWKKLSGIKPNKLYEKNWQEKVKLKQQSIVSAYKEEAISVTHNAYTTTLFPQEVIKNVKNQGKLYYHIGMMAIGVKGLHRRKIGTKVMIMFYDDSFGKAREASIGSIEMDMNAGCGVFYSCPDFAKYIKDLSHLKIGIQTLGYENYEGKNLSVAIKTIGRLTTNIQSKYKINVKDIVEQISSQGIIMVAPMEIDSSHLDGNEWDLSKFLNHENTSRVPTKALIYQNLQGGESLRFSNYKQTRMHDPTENNSDEDEDLKILGEQLNIKMARFYTMQTPEEELREVIQQLEREKQAMIAKLEAKMKESSKMAIVEDNFNPNNEYLEDTYSEYEDLEFEKLGLTGWEDLDQDSIETEEITEWENPNQVLHREIRAYKSVSEQIEDIFGELLKEHGNYDMALKNLEEKYDLDKIEKAKSIEEIAKSSTSSEIRPTKRPKEEQTAYEDDMRDDWKRKELTVNPIEASKDRNFERIGSTYKKNFYPSRSEILNLDNVPPQFYYDQLVTWEGIVKNEWEARKKDGMDMWSWMDGRITGLVLYLVQDWISKNQAAYNDIKSRGDRPENFVKMVKDRFLIEDPTDERRTALQRLAQRELEALNCEDPTKIQPFMAEYLKKASEAKKGFDVVYVERLFDRLPEAVGKVVKADFVKDGNSYEAGIGIAVSYISTWMRAKCIKETEAKTQKKASLAFCRSIYTIGDYKKRKILKRVTNYNKNRRKNYVRRPSIKKKCRCYICQDENHLANRCPRRYTNQARASLIDGLDEDIVSIASDDEDIENFLEIIELDEFIAHSSQEHEHTWEIGGKKDKVCEICSYFTDYNKTVSCKTCETQYCKTCSDQLALEVTEVKKPTKEETMISDLKLNVKNLEFRVTILEHKVEMQNLQDKFETMQIRNKSEITEIPTTSLAMRANESNYIKTSINKTAGCYVETKISFNNENRIITALIDSGSTHNIICPTLIPASWINTTHREIIMFAVDNSKYNLNQELIDDIKLQFQEVDETFGIKYKLGQTYVAPQPTKTFIIGHRFLTNENGSVTIHKDYITIQKTTGIYPTARHELKSEFARKHGGRPPLFSNIPEIYNKIPQLHSYQPQPILGYKNEIGNQSLLTMVKELEALGFIGDDITKNRTTWVCDFKIINPDINITCATIPYTPADKEVFEKQIKELLDNKLIKKADPTCRHRTAAFIVRNHSEEVAQKPRIVYNYKRLNDNMHTDPFNIPHKISMINLIQKANIFSKFDLKAGFHHMKLKDDFKDWTTFTCSEGLYTWNVCPFGIANAPCAFQRFMQESFGDLKFALLYIDDILIASNNEKEHIEHLKIFFNRVKEVGCVLSKKKSKMFLKEVEYLGVEIKEGKISLQPHIVNKIKKFDKNKLNTLKGLQAYLGLLNYARGYIKDLSKLVGPLYKKTGKNGQRIFNKEDWNIIFKIEREVSKIKPLERPKETDYIIIETDASEEGWGAVLVCKPDKYSGKDTEKIAGYASGNFGEKKTWTSLDYEIEAINEALNKFQIYLDKDFTIRTDCEAIVKGIKTEDYKKRSKTRWIKLRDNLLKDGYKPTFEHIKGNKNFLPNFLSREGDFILKYLQNPDSTESYSIDSSESIPLYIDSKESHSIESDDSIPLYRDKLLPLVERLKEKSA
uniref:194K polypeptide n=1 Tax=Rice tungro bacilliform virus TaxID=10654 RepID=Q86366_9VIRU|nr:194K polypeptide [Rice tungro bacilliform virus]prf//1817177A capsid protein [Rice tungro bacilliform virus]